MRMSAYAGAFLGVPFSGETLSVNRPLYSRGDKGAEIRLLQETLTKAGFDTKGIDGDFGTNTEAAVRAFQRSIGLPVTGVVWLETFEALTKAGAAPPAEPVASSSVGAGKWLLGAGAAFVLWKVLG